MEDNNIQATVSDSNPVKKKRGGARPGAGRKKTTHKEYMIYASKEVSENLDSLEGIPITRYVCEAILQRAARDRQSHP